MMFTPGTIWQIAQHSDQDSADNQPRDSTIVLYADRTPDPPPPIAWAAARIQTVSNSIGRAGMTVNLTYSPCITLARKSVNPWELVLSAFSCLLRPQNADVA
jgi:hypothetical protein